MENVNLILIAIITIIFVFSIILLLLFYKNSNSKALKASFESIAVDVLQEKNSIINKNNIEKSSKEYRNFIIENIKKFLKEIDLYTSFTRKVIIFDINFENTDIDKINFIEYPTLEINIKKYSFYEEHPFRLTTKHRFNMKKEIENYDWFGYSEDDTIITNKTMEYIVENLNLFYKKERKVFTIPRMVYNKEGEYFYSDIIQQSPLRGEYTSPRNRFGACWVYRFGRGFCNDHRYTHRGVQSLKRICTHTQCEKEAICRKTSDIKEETSI